MNRIAVLIVDDSAVVRQVLQAQLAADPEIEVIGAVADPLLAMERMKLRWPDVLVLDVEMPRMDGITFLKKSWRSGQHLPSSVPRSRRRGRRPPWRRWPRAPWPLSPSPSSG